MEKSIEEIRHIIKQPEDYNVTRDSNLSSTLNFSFPAQHNVKIHFPTDPVGIALVLDWMYNSRDFANCHMDDDIIKKARDAGIDITILPTSQDNPDHYTK